MSSAPATTTTEQVTRVTGRTPSITRRGVSLKDMSTAWLHSLSVIGISVSVGLLSRGVFGTAGIFRYQLCTFLVTLSVLPTALRYWHESRGQDDQGDEDREIRIPWKVLVPSALWTVVCGGPVMYAILLDLFTGHRRPDAEWYSAVWRIFAILFLWICFAVVNERKIKPFWFKYMAQQRARAAPASRSIAVQAEEMAIELRNRKLQALHSKKSLLSRRKVRLESSLKNINDKIAALNEESKGDSSAEQNKDEEKDEMNRKLQEQKDDLDDVCDQLALLEHEWTESLHIEHYRRFYR